MTEPRRPLRYQSYLLRLWEERSVSQAQVHSSWRFSLEDPHSGARLGFADLEQLIAFLTNQLHTTEEIPDHD